MRVWSRCFQEAQGDGPIGLEKRREDLARLARAGKGKAKAKARDWFGQ